MLVLPTLRGTLTRPPSPSSSGEPPQESRASPSSSLPPP